MSRRSPEVESATGNWVARERLAATLGSAAGATDSGDAVDLPNAGSSGISLDSRPVVEHSSGLLEVSASGLPVRPLPAPSGGGAGRRSEGDAGAHSGALPGRRHSGRPPRPPLSAWLRARTGVRAAALLGILAAALGACFWWQAGTGGAQVVALSEAAPAAEEVSAQEASAPAAAADPAPSGEEASPGPGSITVHVAGAVARPGVVQLPAGSRLHQAIAEAGGATEIADPDRLNLAAVLEDGQKVQVPIRGEPEQTDAPTGGGAPAQGSATSGTGATVPGTGTGGAKVNINTAGVEELGTLPRVGPVLAQRIVDWRQQHGRFKTVQELDAVDGIGPKLLAALLPLVGI